MLLFSTAAFVLSLVSSLHQNNAAFLPASEMSSWIPTTSFPTHFRSEIQSVLGFVLLCCFFQLKYITLKCAETVGCEVLKKQQQSILSETCKCVSPSPRKLLWDTQTSQPAGQWESDHDGCLAKPSLRLQAVDPQANQVLQ